MATTDSRGDWPRTLFVERPELFLPFLEQAKGKAKEEVEALSKVMKEKGVPKGGRVLDLGCGIGRHSVPLAKRGHEVVGLDLSPEFIRRAKAYAREQGVTESTSFEVGDMRRIASVLRGQSPFDVIINMWTSLGYYGEDVDREVLRQLARLAAAGGVLLLEMGNRDGILQQFRDRDWDAAGDIVQLVTRRYEPDRSYMVNEWAFYRREGEDLRFLGNLTVDHRFYAADDLRELVESAGWVVEDIYSGLGLEPLDPRSPKTRMLLVARKGEPSSETTEEG
ncbi:MAG: class I SAM-dependent methyltransferase [Thermoplasmata archaeon]